MIANLFEWNWPSVANECTTVLGPKGYGAVQVAPPEDSIRLAGSTHAWWDVYQPVAYDLNSRMGTEAQFAQMVTACHNAGVRVYADAVLNHTAGANQSSTDSYGGASFNPATFTYNNVPYDSSDFHFSPPCPNADMSISDWNNVQQVQECDLSSLSDLYTEKDDVRAKLVSYLNKLVGYGVDGFRMDAAKHIAQADMANILSRVNNTTWTGSRPYVYQEVIPGSSGQLAPSAFEGNGSVIEFTYAYDLKSQFNGNIANLKTFGQSWGIEPSNLSSVMVTNHDTERSGQTLSYKDGSKYTLATVFELAWGYGTPQVYSGFDFSTSDQSPCGRRQRLRDRHRLLVRRVDLHRPQPGHRQHGRLAQRRPGPVGGQLVGQRLQCHRVQPRQHRLGRDQQRHQRGHPDLQHRPRARQLLRRHPRHPRRGRRLQRPDGDRRRHRPGHRDGQPR